jgi:hypothetical protein
MTEKKFKGMTNKKTIKMVNKILSDDKKRDLYTPEELAYMERQAKLLQLDRDIRKLRKKQEKGFGYGDGPTLS